MVFLVRSLFRFPSSSHAKRRGNPRGDSYPKTLKQTQNRLNCRWPFALTCDEGNHMDFAFYLKQKPPLNRAVLILQNPALPAR
jgi:hypothetical protein